MLFPVEPVEQIINFVAPIKRIAQLSFEIKNRLIARYFTFCIGIQTSSTAGMGQSSPALRMTSLKE